MLAWLLFYTSLFDLRKAPVQDVLDPGGVVQSQAVESGEARKSSPCAQCLARAAATMAARFLDDFFGSGVQQIALACDDIFATVERLRFNGTALLPIPENYYDDLEARFDLAPALLDRLRDGDILYDRDGDAEFFHVYTRTQPGGFFFEIVERRAYKGYGAVNAPIRLAAQARSSRATPAIPRL